MDMRTAPRTIRLAGEDLGDQRHLCALVDGPDDLYDVLMPFIIDGIETGDRAIHLVDPDAREAHLERLAASGIDVPAATDSGQLEVATWTESYLRGGRFDGAAQLSFLRQRLDAGAGLGYSRSRMVGTMEWALEAETMAPLLEYERRVDEVIRWRPDVVICTYELSRHSARTVADVLGAHAVAIVGGVLRMNRAPARPSARDRILEAASRLFGEAGIQGTGVDSLIKAADVAKATFYRHFPSKDDLVVAWLRDPRTRWLDGVRARAEAPGDAPGEVIQRFFEALADWLETRHYRGCPYLNTAVEIDDPSHPARLVIREYLQEIEDYLTGHAAAAGYRDPQLLAAKLLTLAAGSISLAVTSRSNAPVLIAQEAALTLLANTDRD